MTYKQALLQALRAENKTDVQKLIAFAYYAGREAATKKISDEAVKIFSEQRERAKKCRYHKMAREIVGDQRYIYSDDYSGDYTKTFGDDIAPEI